MFHLIDTFNNRTISRHRTLVAAVRAKDRHSRDVVRYNGKSAFIPKKIVEIVNGEAVPVDYYAIMQAEQQLY